MGEEKGTEPRGRRRQKLLRDVLLVLGLAVLGVGSWHLVLPRSSPVNYFLTPQSLPAIPHQQRPPTMDPALFKGRAAAGYRVARDHPGLLEKMPCYCGCYLSVGHQNNLDCFRDRHGETCDLCLRIAIRAEQLLKKGYGVEDIKTIVDRAFAPRGQ